MCRGRASLLLAIVGVGIRGEMVGALPERVLHVNQVAPGFTQCMGYHFGRLWFATLRMLSVFDG